MWYWGRTDVGAQLEIVEAEESTDHVFERGGNGRFVHVGEVGFAVHAVAMEARTEGAGCLAGGAGEVIQWRRAATLSTLAPCDSSQAVTWQCHS